MIPSDPLKFNEGPFFTDEDLVAKTIIVALGISSQIEAKPSLPKTRRPTHHGVFSSIGFHDTHWIFVGKISGFADSKENGYVAAGWPKKECSREQFAAHAALICTAMLGSPDNADIKIIDTKPEN